MISFKLFYESKLSNDREYDEYLNNFYKNTNLLNQEEIEFLTSLAKSSEMFFDVANIKIEKSDSNNVVVRWLEQDNVIILLGIVTKLGKLTKNDLNDLYKWIDLLVKKMVSNNKILLTSPNKVSELMLKHVKSKIESYGKKYIQTYIGNDVVLGDSPYLQWKTYKIEAK